MQIARCIERKQLVLCALQEEGAVFANEAQRCLVLLLIGYTEAKLPFVDIDLCTCIILCLQAVVGVYEVGRNAHFFIAGGVLGANN